MKRKSLGAIALLCVGTAVLLSGCKGGAIGQKGVICGGTKDDTDYNAPKMIRSDELISFDTGFYRCADLLYDTDRSYRFKMSVAENGVLTITEGYDEKLKCETDATFAASLQKLIRKYELVKLNGIQKQTYGLPPEYAPYWIKAEYASKETLYFSVNGDPYAEWTGAVLELFAKEFARHGMEDLLPPKENSTMTRFSLSYAHDGMGYRYSEILIPVTEEEKARSLEDIATNGINEENCVKKAYGESWDREGKAVPTSKRMAGLTEAYYQGLQQIAEETELRIFQNGELMPPDFDDTAPQYYEFYVEYASGKRMSGFSDDPAQCEKFRTIAERFSAYCEDYLDQNAD